MCGPKSFRREALENARNWTVEDIDTYLSMISYERSQKQTYVQDANDSEGLSSSVSFAEDEELEEESQVYILFYMYLTIFTGALFVFF